MTIDQLRYVTEVAKCRSFNQASENLYISQPSLSVSIRKLEEELGEPLFVRSSAGVTLTPFGIELLPYIQNIISLYEQMPLQVYGRASRNTSRISVANGSFRYFSAAIGRLYMAHKGSGIHIEYHDVPVEQSMAMVRAGTAQIGGFSIWSFQKSLMEARLSREGVVFVPFGATSPTVTVGPKNPLWAREENWVTLDMIREYPIIYSFSEHSNILLKKLGIYNRNNLITCKERAGRNELMQQTDGISVGGFPMQAYCHSAAYPGQRVFRLKDYDIQMEFGYVYNRSYALSRLAIEFIGYLKELVSE